MKNKIEFGSVCSGIEAARLAFSPFGLEQVWNSEIAEFPCKVLNFHYPDIPNLGDMRNISKEILRNAHPAPDLFCGGTPCQSFSLAGWKNGLTDKRGQLTLSFIEIANAIDKVRQAQGKESAIILWENVEGVLNDKTNAFGNFIAGLAGYEEEIKLKKWSKSGFIFGKSRNIAWRVLDAKYFGLPQQRRRLYVLAGGKDFRPDQWLFEFDSKNILKEIKNSNLLIARNNHGFFTDINHDLNDKDCKIVSKGKEKFEFFRSYTDCLYSAYATKWNGNAAAYNGSLYVSQNDRVRRFTPLECERLMGLPDNYTLIDGNSDTNRYHAIGNSWAIPVVKWIGLQLSKFFEDNHPPKIDWTKILNPEKNNLGAKLFLLGGVYKLGIDKYLNASAIPNNPKTGKLSDVVQTEEVPEKFYLSPQACKGILRRKSERNLKMNEALLMLLTRISKQEVDVSSKSKIQVA